jgi:hypothetical protein
MKRFITMVSHQNKGNLKKLVYEPVDNESLRYEFPSSFPIVPVIATNVDVDERFILLVIKATGSSETKNGYIEINYRELIDDIAGIKSNLGLSFSYDIEVIDTPYDTSIADLERLANNIAAAIQPGEEIFACTTFGEKTDTVALHQALLQAYIDNYLDIDIESCVYGQTLPQQERGKIKDVTNFLFRGTSLSALQTGQGHEESTDTAENSLWSIAASHKRYVTFISLFGNIAPLQYYDATGKLEIYRPVCYPIIPCIAASVKDGDQITVNAVLFEGINNGAIEEIMRNNTDKLRVELQALAIGLQQQGLRFTWELESLSTPYNADNTSLNRLCDDISSLIVPGDEVYADLTFGEKGDTIAMVQALTEALLWYVGRIDVALCVYGYVPRADGEYNKIKDVTAFVLKGAGEHLLREGGYSDPASLRAIIAGGDDGND